MKKYSTKNNQGFSLIEIIVVVAIMIVLLAILTPSLLRYVENSRMQKDESAMDELCEVVRLALSDAEIFDEAYSYAIRNNYVTYSDSSGVYGAKYADEEFWAPDGAGWAVTITFNPDEDGNYILANGRVNNMTQDNGSVAESRTADGLKQCLFSEMGDAKLYHKVEQTFGSNLYEKSATYQNSSYTVFITFEAVSGIKRADIYGEWNGTNLDESCPAALGSGTSDYTEDDEPIVTKPDGGTQTPDFDNSDLIGGGSSPNTPNPPQPPSNVVPENGIYYVGVTTNVKGNYEGYTAKYEPGDVLPTEVSVGDIFVCGVYEYRYGQYWTPNYNWSTTASTSYAKDWGAVVRDTSKTAYETPLSEINTKPVNNFSYTWRRCRSLTTAPTIPQSAKTLHWAFEGCSNLAETPVLPNQVRSLQGTFISCSKLTVAPTLPSTVTDMKSTFSGCYILNTYVGSTEAAGDFSDYQLPPNLTTVNCTFDSCSAMKVAPRIPEKVTNVQYAFYAPPKSPNLTEQLFVPCHITSNQIYWMYYSGSSVEIVYYCTSTCTGCANCHASCGH